MHSLHLEEVLEPVSRRKPNSRHHTAAAFLASGQWPLGVIDELVAESENGEAEAAWDDYGFLNRNLLMPSILIFDSRVCRGRPSFAAAPAGPPTRPRV